MLKKVSILSFTLMFAFALFSQVKAQKSINSAPEKALPAVDRQALVDYAKQYLGTPYRKSGMDPKKGFDCSGYVKFVFSHFMITLPRSSREYKTLGKALKPEEFRLGDVLVFYGYKDNTHIGHLGIICEANGMKSRFIHASSGKAMGVTISNLGSQGYKKRFYKCIDVIQQ
ncbi:MAG: C40 family peptidase [Bacteroidota bacterium]|jgi:cell wall-associated NlpC family hydrolase